MTIEAYTPEQIDQLALRALDLCACLRQMAQRGRAEELATIALHDKKALEWLGKLEEWAHKTEADLGLQALKAQGERKAVSMRRKKPPPDR